MVFIINVFPKGCLRSSLLKYNTSKAARAAPPKIVTVTDTVMLLAKSYGKPISLMERE